MIRILTILVWLELSAGAAEPAFTARVMAVHDGDSITVYDGTRPQIKVRLAEIDAPELNQPYGAAARSALSAMVFQKTVRIIPAGRDRNQRLIAQVVCGKNPVNNEMVKAGAAWRYDLYSKSQPLADLQSTARKTKRGLWALPDPVPPWAWRKPAASEPLR